MRLVKLDRTGHTEVEIESVDEMVKALEKEMNVRGMVAIAEAPGKEPEYLRDPKAARDLEEESTVTLMPQLAGG